MSGSEKLRTCGRTDSARSESEVLLLGRAGAMPKPGVTESLCSGRISPNRSPFWRGAVGDWGAMDFLDNLVEGEGLEGLV